MGPIKTLKVKLTLTEELLGSASGDPEIHKQFIASKAPDAPSREEEVEAIGIDGVVEKTKTIFPKEDGKPFIWDYQIRGAFKDSCGMLRRAVGTESKKLMSYKKVIDGLIFVKPRKIFLTMPEGAVIGECQRPLRASTAQGERIALANSETVPAGTTLEFTVHYFKQGKGKEKLDELALIKEWLDYGALRGLGSWRNSGKGAYSYEIID